jgi:hypothetical protein
MDVRTDQQIARPLRVLVPLIKHDLEQGREAAERAAMAYYCAAGGKLLEAKSQFSAVSEFNGWIERHFRLSRKQADRYMDYAIHVSNTTETQVRARTFRSLSEFEREQDGHTRTGKPAWHHDVKAALSETRARLLKAERERATEQEAQRLLALQLIKIGYKALAGQMHPDRRGGSQEAMTRLNIVRKRLEQCV